MIKPKKFSENFEKSPKFPRKIHKKTKNLPSREASRMRGPGFADRGGFSYFFDGRGLLDDHH